MSLVKSILRRIHCSNASSVQVAETSASGTITSPAQVCVMVRKLGKETGSAKPEHRRDDRNEAS